MAIEARDDHGGLMRRHRVSVDCGRRLGSQIAALSVEVQRAHAVRALPASKLHPALNPFYAISFHFRDSSVCIDQTLDALVGRRK